MTKTEKHAQELILENKNILFFLAISLFGAYLRFVGRLYVSGDMTVSLIPWFEQIKSMGGLSALDIQVGDYNLLYQTLISFMTYLDFNVMYCYKILSIFFDYVLATAGGLLVAAATNGKIFDFKFNIAYASILIMPITIFDSAFWGQCDAIYTSFIVLTLLYLYKEKYLQGFIFFGLALSFKFQAIFLLPFIITYYFYKKNFSLRYILVSVITFWSSGIIAFLNGRNLLAPFQIYFNQTNTYPFMWMNVVSFWQLVGENYDLLSKFAIALTLAICGIGFYEALSKNMDLRNPENFLKLCTWFLWTILLFMPAMHERYTYPVLILFILLTTINKKYIIYLISVLISDLFTYSLYLFNGPGLNTGIVVAVMVCYAIYTVKVFCGIKPETVCVVKSEKE